MVLDCRVVKMGEKGVVIPPRGILAIAWLVAGETCLSKIARLIGGNRSSLMNTVEFESFRSEYLRVTGKRINPRVAFRGVA